MSYDKYLEDQREWFEDRGEADKVFLIIKDESEVVFSAVDSLSVAEKEMQKLKTASDPIKLELGWIWETEMCSDFDYVYRLMNIIESYGE